MTAIRRAAGFLRADMRAARGAYVVMTLIATVIILELIVLFAFPQEGVAFQ